uniref:Uncharacterized protein LOC111105525 n=1 Tax=Crassostrea virginica TaxID=6565 RepID=A0A8B8AZ27_CRAVI|nr:uncharacterized protein LOC111105525 [Crassostrea virginica]
MAWNYHQFCMMSVIVGFAVFQVCFDFEIPCNVSTSTVKVVSKCPTTVNEQEEAALRKNCAAIPNKCPKFVYHCVRNWLSTELYEVCAPPLHILGSMCAEYNEDVMSIRSTVHSCMNFTPSCPERYSSTEQYKYPICHKLSNLSNTTPHIERRTNKSQTDLPSNVENKKQFVYDLLWFALSVLAAAALAVAFTLLYRGIKMCKKDKPKDIESQMTQEPFLPKEIMIQSSKENNEKIAQKSQKEDFDSLSENNESSATKTVKLQSFGINLPTDVSCDAKPQKENNSESQIGKRTETESSFQQTSTQEVISLKKAREKEISDIQTRTEKPTLMKTSRINVIQHPQEESWISERSTKVVQENYDHEFENPKIFIRTPFSLRNRDRGLFGQRPHSCIEPGNSSTETTDEELEDIVGKFDNLNLRFPQTSLGMHPRRRHFSSVCYCEKWKSSQKQQSNPTTWTSKDLRQYILEVDPNLAPQAEAMFKDDIDGKAFLLLEIHHMKNHLKFKLGPSLKLFEIKEKLKTQSRQYEHSKRW